MTKPAKEIRRNGASQVLTCVGLLAVSTACQQADDPNIEFGFTRSNITTPTVAELAAMYPNRHIGVPSFGCVKLSTLGNSSQLAFVNGQQINLFNWTESTGPGKYNGFNITSDAGMVVSVRSKTGNEYIMTVESNSYTLPTGQTEITSIVMCELDGVPATTLPLTIELGAVVRDFKKRTSSGGHPDMQKTIATHTGVVLSNLGSDGLPVFNTSGSYSAFTGATDFYDWFRDSSRNMKTDFEFILSHQGNGVYSYSNSSYFPIDGMLWGNDGNTHNFHFTTKVENYKFLYRGGEEFTFTGDDDVWVFVNGKLAIDLGGVHGALSKTLKMDQIAVAHGMSPGGTYDVDMFHAERYTTQSNFKLTTSAPPLGCGDGLTLGDEECDDGDHDSSDGCSAECTFEYCGDNVQQDNEGCDDGNNIDGDGCTASCVQEFCGDGIAQAALGEECDNGTTANGPTRQCSSMCEFTCRIGAICNIAACFPMNISNASCGGSMENHCSGAGVGSLPCSLPACSLGGNSLGDCIAAVEARCAMTSHAECPDT